MISKDYNPFDRQVGGSHYQTSDDVVGITEFIMTNNIPYAEGAAMKYIYRHSNKNGIEDLRKAYHFLQFIAYVKYKEKL